MGRANRVLFFVKVIVGMIIIAYILNVKIKSFMGIGISIFKKNFKRQLHGVVRC